MGDHKVQDEVSQHHAHAFENLIQTFSFNINLVLSVQNGSYGQHICVPKIW